MPMAFCGSPFVASAPLSTPQPVSVPQGSWQVLRAAREPSEAPAQGMLAGVGCMMVASSVAAAEIGRRRHQCGRHRRGRRARGAAASRVALRARCHNIAEFSKFRSEDGEEFELFPDQVLGSGAGGTVYRGRVVRTGKPIAVKAIPTWRLVLMDEGEDALEKVEEEYGMYHAIGQHANIMCMLARVDIYLEDSTSKLPHYKFLVMELVQGSELTEHIAMSGAMRESLARHLFLQVLDGLSHLHQRGVIHRDLKPDNVLVSGDEITFDSHVKLVDFGVAKCVHSGPLTTVVGTPMVMAPEVAEAKLALDEARLPPGQQSPTFSWSGGQFSAQDEKEEAALVKGRSFCPKIDVWSAGIVLYTCLTGKLPFKSENEIIGSDYQRELLNHCSLESQDLISKMLEKDADDRISLQECLQHPWVDCSMSETCTVPLDTDILSMPEEVFPENAL